MSCCRDGSVIRGEDGSGAVAEVASRVDSGPAADAACDVRALSRATAVQALRR